MSDAIKLRDANLDDKHALVALTAELGYETTSAEIQQRLSQILDKPDHKVFVAVSDKDSVLGWIHVYYHPVLMKDVLAELGGLVVTENARNQGIGKLLLIKAQDWAKQVGCQLMVVRTRSTRLGAHRFYEEAGYQFWKDQKVYTKDL
jgi:GNAT superfamily N-acetyltransferase